MDAAWVAGGFGLAGSLIGAAGALLGTWLSHRHDDDVRAGDIARERFAVLSALATELQLMSQEADVRASALLESAKENRDIPIRVLKKELFGEPYFLSRMRDWINFLPTELIEKLTTAQKTCKASDDAILRWVDFEERISPGSVKTIVSLMQSAGNRCSWTADSIKQWLKVHPVE